SATRSIGGLRLKMVDVVLAVLKAETQRVRSLQPAHIAAGDVLVVAKQERVGDVRVPDIGKRIEGEAGVSGLQRVAAVGAGNLQNVEPIVLVQVDVLSGQTEPGIAEDAVEQDVRGHGIRRADTRALNQAGGASRLTAVSGVPAGCAE